MFDLISVAHAQAGTSADTTAAVGNVVFLVLLFAIFYFLLIRPQQKQLKTHKEMIENLQRGDSVVTGGGILGRIHRIEEDVLVLDVGEVEVTPKTFKPMRLKVKRSTIAAVTAKGSTAASGDASPAE